MQDSFAASRCISITLPTMTQESLSDRDRGDER